MEEIAILGMEEEDIVIELRKSFAFHTFMHA
jgi:hypothetical protein